MHWLFSQLAVLIYLPFASTGFSIKFSYRITIGDIIEYPLPRTYQGKSTGLGIVLECSEPLCIHPLCRREEDDGLLNETVLIQDESQESLLVPSQDILSILNDVYFSQRPIEDRILNPHGEHSEDVYLIKTNSLDLNRIFLSEE